MVQIFTICTVCGEPLSQTAQSFMPELIYGINRSLEKVSVTHSLILKDLSSNLIYTVSVLELSFVLSWISHYIGGSSLFFIWSIVFNNELIFQILSIHCYVYSKVPWIYIILSGSVASKVSFNNWSYTWVAFWDSWNICPLVIPLHVYTWSYGHPGGQFLNF
jgi:hypothetical protein